MGNDFGRIGRDTRTKVESIMFDHTHTPEERKAIIEALEKILSTSTNRGGFLFQDLAVEDLEED